MTTNPVPDPDPIRIQGFHDQKLKKNYSWNFFYIFLGSKTAIYLSLGLHKVCPSIEEAFSSQKRPSNTSKHELLQHFFYFCGSFLPSWIRIHRPDWIRIQSGSGSATLIQRLTFWGVVLQKRAVWSLEDVCNLSHLTENIHELNGNRKSLCWSLWSESVEWFIEDQAFSRSYDSTPFLYPVRKLDRQHTGRPRKRDNLLMGVGGGRVGEEPSHTTAKKPDFL